MPSAYPAPELDPLWALQRMQALEPYAILDTAPEQAFDDIAQLAATACQAPTALVSLVAGDRQWFKARIGFDRPQTGIESAVCRFVVGEPDVLVFPDLTQDERTRNNPMVVGPPHVRFYAGAPLRTATGVVLGSLCVLDASPRPEGLTAAQTEDLRRLARLAVHQFELRRLLLERDARLTERDALDRTRSRFADVELGPDAIMRAVVQGVLAAMPEAEGVAAAAVEGDEIVYKTTDGTQAPLLGLRLPISGSLAGWCALTGAQTLVTDAETDPRAVPRLPGLASAVCTPVWVGDRIAGALLAQSGQRDAFSQRDLNLLAQFAAMATAAFAAADDANTLRALQLSDQRQRALLDLGESLREMGAIAGIASAAARMMGAELGADLTGHGTVDPRAETVAITSVQHEPDVAGLSSLYAFRDFGPYIDELKAGALVTVADVETDPRTRASTDRLRAMGVGAFINIPVMEQGELAAVMFVHFAAPRDFTPEDIAFVRAVADHARAAIARLRDEERQAVLNGEISHRLKNSLAMVQAIANQTLKGVVRREVMEAFNRRLAALATAHDLLLASNWSSADLAGVVRRVTANLGAEERVVLDGPPVGLGARATLSTSMLFHELATNALKYGALSTAHGHVEVLWSLDGAVDDPVLTLRWKEVGGPEVSPPGRGGFGSRLLKMGLIGTGGTNLCYEPAGFVATFTALLRQAQAG